MLRSAVRSRLAPPNKIKNPAYLAIGGVFYFLLQIICGIVLKARFTKRHDCRDAVVRHSGGRATQEQLPSASRLASLNKKPVHRKMHGFFIYLVQIIYGIVLKARFTKRHGYRDEGGRVTREQLPSASVNPIK